MRMPSRTMKRFSPVPHTWPTCYTIASAAMPFAPSFAMIEFMCKKP